MLFFCIFIDFYEDVIFPKALNIRSINGFKPAPALESIVLTEAFELFSVSEVNVALSGLQIFFEVAVVFDPIIINVGEIGKVESGVKLFGPVIVKDSMPVETVS